jgi:hypothetical protein
MAAAMPPAKKQDRSRDEAALGGEVLSRFSGINVLIAGPLRSLGVETAKNVILTGPKAVGLWDPEPATVADIGLNVSSWSTLSCWFLCALLQAS